MAKEIYLYSGIYDFTAQEFMESIDSEMGNEVNARINSPGGSVFAFWGMAAKMQEHGNVTAKVDGGAFSSAANLLLYANRVEALDVSTFMFHRADMYISSQEDQEFLDRVNADLKAKMVKRVDAKKLKEMKGITIDELFDSGKRIDLFLNAKEAKQLGIVDKINKIDPSKASAFSEIFKMAAEYKEQIKTYNKSDMNIEKLKAEHPEVYNQVIKLGAEAENDRVSAWMAYVDVDAEAVKEGIESGKSLTQKTMAEFGRKVLNVEALKTLEASSAKPVETKEDETVADESKEDKEAKAFWDKVKADAKAQIK